MRSQRSSRNVDAEEAGVMSSMDGFVDLYDDDIGFIESRLVAPTHPEALKHYRFDLLGRRFVDDRVDFD